jgi:hypothetical protein
MTTESKMTEQSNNPWEDARMHARKLEQALVECGWRHGSCHSDFDETGDKWAHLIAQAKELVTGLGELLGPHKRTKEGFALDHSSWPKYIQRNIRGPFEDNDDTPF